MTGDTLEDVNANTNNKLYEDNTVWPNTNNKLTLEDVNGNTNNQLNEDNTVWPDKR